jgi:hypothetical protein
MASIPSNLQGQADALADRLDEAGYDFRADELRRAAASNVLVYLFEELNAVQLMLQLPEDRPEGGDLLRQAKLQYDQVNAAL